jgi:hypothetical protein
MSYNINNITCSFEEYLTNLYLEELKDNGFIREIIYQPKSFILSKEVPMKFYKVKETKKGLIRKYSVKKNLINEHIYSADFKVIWEPYKTELPKLVSFLSTFTAVTTEINQDIPFIGNYEYLNVLFSYIETKGNFDKNGDQRLFTSRTQPWVYQQYGIYVQMIKPFDLFKSTFIPQKALEFMFYKKDVTKKNKTKSKEEVSLDIVKLKNSPKYNWKYKSLNQWLNGTTE